MSQTQEVRGRATNVKRDKDGTLTVRYHWTDVVTVQPDGTIVLDTNGYKTVTTKTRMNQASNQYALGFSVWQKDYQWHVTVDRKGEERFDVIFADDRLTIPPVKVLA
jgi:hypothetical protein